MRRAFTRLTPLLLSAACSSSSASPIATTSANGGNDGAGMTAGAGGTPFAPCPSEAPRAGDPCLAPPSSGACEYGGNAHRTCSLVFSCTNGSWSSAPLPSPCPQNASACPVAYSPSPGTCAPPPSGEDLSCEYDEGRCACEPCTTASGTSGEWVCRPWGAPSPSCAWPRPHVGEPCSTEGTLCEYRACCDPPSLGPRLRCENGAWTDDESGCSCEAAVCAGACDVVVAGLNNPTVVAPDDGDVYWLESEYAITAGTFGSAIQRAPVTSCDAPAASAVTLFATPPGASLVATMAVGAGHVAFVTNDGLFSLPKSGGAPTLLVHARVVSDVLATGDTAVAALQMSETDPFRLVAFDLATGAHVTIVDLPGPAMLALGGDTLYLTTPTGIGSIPLAGGALATVVDGELAPGAIAVDHGVVYWTFRGDDGGTDSPPSNGRIRARPVDGSAPATTLVDGLPGPYAIGVSGGYVYWLSGGANPSPPQPLRRVAIGGGEPETVAGEAGPHGYQNAHALTVAGSWLYVVRGLTGPGNGSVLRLAAP